MLNFNNLKFYNNTKVEKNTVSKFSGYDSKERFEANLKTQNENWIYRHKIIEYRNNELGYRTKSFDQINWAESIVVLGDSYVYGAGLSEEDNLTSCIQRLTGYETINLGTFYSPIEISCYNSLMIYKNLPAPKAIVQIWTTVNAYGNYVKDDYITYTPKDNEYINEINWPKKNLFLREVDKSLWENKTCYIEGTFFFKTARMFGIDFFKTVDTSRDLSHPGIETVRNAAGKIAAKIK